MRVVVFTNYQDPALVERIRACGATYLPQGNLRLLRRAVKGVAGDIKTDGPKIALEEQTPVTMRRQHQEMSGRNDPVSTIVQYHTVLGRKQRDGKRVVACGGERSDSLRAGRQFHQGDAFGAAAGSRGMPGIKSRV